MLAGRAGLLHLLALHGLKGVLPFFELAGRQLEQHFLVRVAELPHKQDLVLLGQGGHADAAVVADDLALCGLSVFKLDLVEQDLDDAALEFCIAGACFLIQLHMQLPFRAALPRLLLLYKYFLNSARIWADSLAYFASMW